MAKSTAASEAYRVARRRRGSARRRGRGRHLGARRYLLRPPLSAATTGTLNVSSSPAGAQVFIDGVQKGTDAAVGRAEPGSAHDGAARNG